MRHFFYKPHGNHKTKMQSKDAKHKKNKIKLRKTSQKTTKLKQQTETQEKRNNRATEQIQNKRLNGKVSPHISIITLNVNEINYQSKDTEQMGGLRNETQLCAAYRRLISTLKTNIGSPWPGSSVSWSIIPYTKRLWIRFPVRATQVAGSIPAQGAYRRQSINVPLSHRCFSLSKNKQINF